jgi:hypothetical protein
MNKFNVGDKVGVVIAFEDDDDIIHKENIFYFNNVKIVSKSDYDDEVFVLDKIKINISAKNYSGFVPRTGYELHFRNTKINDLDYASSYQCYFFVTKTNLTKEDVNKFLTQIIDSKSKRIKYLEEELSKAKNELNECREYINEWSKS